MPIMLPLVCLLGMGVALVQRSAQAVPASPSARDDVPLRLLRWAVGLLSARRAEWGQAMLGELDHIDGRGRRWRFAIGCAGAALLMPPWGRAAAAMLALIAVAAGSAGVYASLVVRYGLGAGDWIYAAIALVLLVTYTMGACLLLRRPGVTVPGLLCGLFVAVAWLAPKGFTFYGFIVTVPRFWAPMVQVLVVPLAAGAVGTLWGGSAAVGRRIARLAGFSAGLGLYLYATIAVAVIGAAGQQDPTWTVSTTVADRLGGNVIFYLWLLPLTTAALGWAGAAATARVRPRPATVTGSASAAATVTVASPTFTGAPQTGGTRNSRRTAYLVLLCAVVAAAVFVAVISGLRG
jgi:hypothetical protein